MREPFAYGAMTNFDNCHCGHDFDDHSTLFNDCYECDCEFFDNLE